MNLKKNIIVSQVGKKVILFLNFNNSNPEYAKNILNELIDVFQ